LKRTNEIRLFTWNALSLVRPGSPRMLTDVLSDYRADILYFYTRIKVDGKWSDAEA
jgi:hypothetical protein